MLRDAIDLTTVKRALVIKLRHHGDVLLTSPVFTVLKNHAPHILLDALVYENTRNMLTHHPAIDTVFHIDRAWCRQGFWSRWVQECALIKTLRAQHYDLILHLTENPRGAVLGHLLKARYRVARSYPQKRNYLWRWSFTHLFPAPLRPRHTVELHLDALRRIGIQPQMDERRLVLVPGSDAEASVDALMAKHGLQRQQFIHFHPTSRWLFKCWTEDKCADFINHMQADGERIVITAAPYKPEQNMVERILAKVKNPVIDLSGALSLKQLAALTRHAKCFVGVDSAPMHIAAAMQIPVVALFGPSGELEWGPWLVKSHVITSQHSCRPCGLDGCGGGKISECLTDISVDEVIRAVKHLTKDK